MAIFIVHTKFEFKTLLIHIDKPTEKNVFFGFNFY